MVDVPKSVKAHLSNARYYLKAAEKFPSPVQDAVQILLLIIGWENVVLAEEELDSWAAKRKIDPKLRKDHAVKLAKVRRDVGVQRVIVGQPGTDATAKQVEYKTGRELSRLREMCQFGSGDEAEIGRLFARHWFSDQLLKGLKEQIEWLELWLPLFENIDRKIEL